MLCPVSGARLVCARGSWEVAVGGAPDVKFALCTVHSANSLNSLNIYIYIYIYIIQEWER